jgi:hypothetical protein
MEEWSIGGANCSAEQRGTNLERREERRREENDDTP